MHWLVMPWVTACKQPATADHTMQCFSVYVADNLQVELFKQRMAVVCAMYDIPPKRVINFDQTGTHVFPCTGWGQEGRQGGGAHWCW